MTTPVNGASKSSWSCCCCGGDDDDDSIDERTNLVVATHLAANLDSPEAASRERSVGNSSSNVTTPRDTKGFDVFKKPEDNSP